MAARVVLGVQYGSVNRSARSGRPWRASGRDRAESMLRQRPFDVKAIQEEFGDSLRDAFASQEAAAPHRELMVTPVDDAEEEHAVWKLCHASSSTSPAPAAAVHPVDGSQPAEPAPKEPTPPLVRESAEKLAQLAANDDVLKTGGAALDGHEPRCLIHPGSHAKVCWDLIVTAMVMFSVIEIPFRIGFSVATSTPVLVVDMILDTCFLLDIFVTFSTGYYNECEVYVTDRKHIAMRYLRGFFVIDVVSILPIDLVVEAQRANNAKGDGSVFRVLRLLRLAKLARLFRLRRLTEILERRLHMHTLAMLKVMGEVVFLIHMLTCLCYWMSPPCPSGASDARAVDQITDPVVCIDDREEEDRAFGSSWVRMFYIDELNLGSRYLASFHLITATLMAVGYGDLFPASTWERLFSILVQLIGAIIFGFILSGVTMLIEASNPRGSERKKRMAEIKEWLRSRSLPADMRQGVWRHFHYLMRQRSIFKDEPEILRNIPTTLRNLIVEQICWQYVQKLQRIFGQEDRSLVAELAVLLQPLQVAYGECVVEAGEPPTDFFTVNTGTIEALLDEEGITDLEKLRQAGKFSIPGLDRDAPPPPAVEPHLRSSLPAEKAQAPGLYSQIGSARRACRRDESNSRPNMFPRFRSFKDEHSTDAVSGLVLCGIFQEAEALPDFPVNPVRLQGGDRRSELLALSKELLNSSLMQFPGACERFAAQQREAQVQLWEACMSSEVPIKKRSPAHDTPLPKARRMQSKILLKGVATEVASLNPEVRYEVFSYMRLDELKFEQVFATRILDSRGRAVTGNETEKDVLNRYIVPPHCAHKVKWDLFIGFLVLYSVMVIPFRFGFNVYVDTTWDVIDYLVDFLFFVDICLSFRTGFLDSEGGVNTIPSQIRKKYLCGWFLIDLISTFPVDKVVGAFFPEHEQESSATRLFRFARLARLLKMARAMKMGRLAEIAESSVDISAPVIRLLEMCTKIFVPAHILACFWHYLTLEHLEHLDPCVRGVLKCSEDGGAHPGPMHWVDAQVIKYSGDLAVSSVTDTGTLFSKYVISVYWVFTTMTTVGYGDIVPSTDLERLFAVCVMIFGATVFGYIIGTIAEMSNDHNRDVLGRNMNLLRHYGSEQNLSEHTQKLVRFHYEFWYQEMSPQHYEAGLLAKLPPSLRKEVITYIHRNVISSIGLFRKKLPDWFVAAAVRLLEPQAFCPGELIIGPQQAGPQQDIFFVHEGHCEAYWRAIQKSITHRPRGHARSRSGYKASGECVCGYGCEEGCQGELRDVYPPGSAFGYEFILQECSFPDLESHEPMLVRCSSDASAFLYALRHGMLVDISRQYPEFGAMVQEVLGDTILREGRRWHKARKRRAVWLEDYQRSAPWLQPQLWPQGHMRSSGSDAATRAAAEHAPQDVTAERGPSPESEFTEMTPPGVVPHTESPGST